MNDRELIQVAIDNYAEELKKAASGEKHNCDPKAYLQTQAPILWERLTASLKGLCKDFPRHLIWMEWPDKIQIKSKLHGRVSTIKFESGMVFDVEPSLFKQSVPWDLVSLSGPLGFTCSLAPNGEAELRYRRENSYFTPEVLARLIVIQVVRGYPSAITGTEEGSHP